MDFRPLFYIYLILCVIVFFEVLITIKKNSMMKVCFLLIISSLFVMNYFSCVGVSDRLQFVLVKCMRFMYVCSTMFVIVHLATPKIPRWVIGIFTFSLFFLVGLRIYYFNDIAINSLAPFSGQVFSVGPELSTPVPLVRYLAFGFVVLVIAMVYYYYRKLFMKMNKEDAYYKQLSRWIISMVVPFFLLAIFGVLGNLYIFQQSVSPYLFSIFSCTIIFSILFRPKILNTTSCFNRHSLELTD